MSADDEIMMLRRQLAAERQLADRLGRAMQEVWALGLTAVSAETLFDAMASWEAARRG